MKNIQKIAFEILSGKDWDDKPIRSSLIGKNFDIESPGFGPKRKWKLINAIWQYGGNGYLGIYIIKNVENGEVKRIPVTCQKQGDIKQTEKAFKQYVQKSGGL